MVRIVDNREEKEITNSMIINMEWMTDKKLRLTLYSGYSIFLSQEDLVKVREASHDKDSYALP